MLKSSILNVRSYHTSIKNIKPVGLILIIIIAAAVFFVAVFFEDEITGFIMFLYPPSPRQGISFYEDLIQLAQAEILWLSFFITVAWVIAVYPTRASLEKFLALKVSKKSVFYVMLISFGFFFITFLISFYTLEQFPNSSDEYAYIFQANMFSQGKLWERAHDLPGFFYNNNITQHDGILLSRFPPGWPLLLSAAFFLNISPALINPVFGLVTLVVFYFFARKVYNEQVAIWSLIALAFSGFYIFNSASYFSHVSCLLVTLLFVYNVYLYTEKNSFLNGVLAGFFLSFVLIIRYYTAVLVFVPFFIYLVYMYRFKSFYLFFLMAVGSLPCMSVLFAYNYAITGNALEPVTVWAYAEEQLGFVKGHTFLKGIEHLIRRLLMFFYWFSPGLLVLYVFFLWRKIKSPADRLLRVEDYFFIFLVIGYFFYYQIGGNQYGPRFYFEALPFLIVFVVSKVLQLREKWAIALLIASLVYSVFKLPFISYREGLIVDQRQDVYDLVDEQNIRNAVVFITSPTSPIRPMPQDDLTRNDPKFQNSVIYALELPGISDQLMEYYNDRSFYKYVRDVDHPEGELIRIR